MQGLDETLGRRWVVAALFGVGSLALAPIAHAVDKVKASEERSPAAGAVDSVTKTLRESVADETSGDEKSRTARLDAAIKAKPDSPEPHWQRGLMKTADGWRDATDARVEAKEAESKYRELRAKTADDLAGNKLLARFCQKNKLEENARGHWQRVISFDPADADARKALGHVLFEGTWATKDGVKRVLKVRKDYNGSLMSWSKKIPGWINDWRSDDAKRKEKAREKLLAIRDAAAIPLLHAALAYGSDEDALLLVEVMRGIPDVAATQVIAEMAVANQSQPVVNTSVEELKNRDENSYVPQLLLALSSPITSEMRLDINPNTGRILYRHVFAREEQFSKQVQAIGRDYGEGQFFGILGPNDYMDSNGDRTTAPNDRLNGTPEQRRDTLFALRAAESMSLAMNRERRKSIENMTIEETNSRVGTVLSKVFDENQASPEGWWTWWNQRNEIRVDSPKPTVAQVQYDQIVDDAQTGVTVNNQNVLPMLLRRSSCFAAGTPVATSEGLKPIESIQTGDLVLAQDVETGEIAWKSVIQPTRRSPTEVLNLSVGDESFVCSLKHPFWKTGRGWTWAKDLAVGDLIRTVNGSLPVTKIQSRPNLPLYNLVVADFSTYFVGKNRTLTHDISFRSPTFVIAPGVMPAKDEVAAK